MGTGSSAAADQPLLEPRGSMMLNYGRRTPLATMVSPCLRHNPWRLYLTRLVRACDGDHPRCSGFAVGRSVGQGAKATQLDQAARFVGIVGHEGGELGARVEHVQQAARDALVQRADRRLVLAHCVAIGAIA